MMKVDWKKYYPDITHGQLLEAISKQLYNEYLTKPIALVRGDYIQQAEEHGLSIKDIYHKEGKPCKAKVKPPYWHRVRSFCVRRGYH